LISGWSLKRDDTESTLLSHVASSNWDSTVLSIHRTKNQERRKKKEEKKEEKKKIFFFFSFSLLLLILSFFFVQRMSDPCGKAIVRRRV